MKTSDSILEFGENSPPPSYDFAISPKSKGRVFIPPLVSTTVPYPVSPYPTAMPMPMPISSMVSSMSEERIDDERPVREIGFRPFILEDRSDINYPIRMPMPMPIRFSNQIYSPVEDERNPPYPILNLMPKKTSYVGYSEPGRRLQSNPARISSWVSSEPEECQDNMSLEQQRSYHHEQASTPSSYSRTKISTGSNTSTTKFRGYCGVLIAIIAIVGIVVTAIALVKGRESSYSSY